MERLDSQDAEERARPHRPNGEDARRKVETTAQRRTNERISHGDIGDTASKSSRYRLIVEEG